MGDTAVNVAKRYEVSRADMDKYAQRSQELAVQSQEDGFFDREIVPVTAPDGTEVDQGRRPARQLVDREAGPAARGVRGRRGRDRRKLVPAQRRRGRRADHVGRQGEGAGAQAARADHHRRDRGQRARVHGRGADPRHPQGARARRHDHRRHRHGGAERGVRRPGDPDHGRVQHPAGEDEPPRRRDRPGPPVRHDRRAHHDHAAQRPRVRRQAGRASRRCAWPAARARR